MTHAIESIIGAIFVLIIFAAYYLGRDLEKINATLTRIAVTTESLTRLMAHDRLGTREQEAASLWSIRSQSTSIGTPKIATSSIAKSGASLLTSR